MANAAYTTLIECGPTLTREISTMVSDIARELLARKFIPQAVMGEINTEGIDDNKKASKLVDAVTKKIQSFPNKFEMLIEVLRTNDYLSDTVDLLLTEYKKSKLWTI